MQSDENLQLLRECGMIGVAVSVAGSLVMFVFFPERLQIAAMFVNLQLTLVGIALLIFSTVKAPRKGPGHVDEDQDHQSTS